MSQHDDSPRPESDLPFIPSGEPGGEKPPVDSSASAECARSDAEPFTDEALAQAGGPVEGLELGETPEGLVAFDLPAAGLEDSELSRGVSREELENLLGEAVPREEAEPVEPPSPAGPIEPMALDEMTEDAELIPEAELEALADELPLPADDVAAAAMETTVPMPADASPIPELATTENVPLAEAMPLAEDLPLAEAVPLAEEVPLAEPTGEAVPMAGLLGAEGDESTAPEALAELVADAEPAEPDAPTPESVREGSLWGEAASPLADLPFAQPIQPVAPASAWYHSGHPVPTKPPADAEDIFDTPPPAAPEGSDIFGWRPSAPAPRDMDIGAAPPANAGEPRPAPSASIRPAADSSARHQRTPQPLEEEIDAVRTPRASDDASSILSELGGSKPVLDIEDSEVPLEDPGVDRTLDDEEMIPEFGLASADDPSIEVEADLPGAPPPVASEAALASASEPPPELSEDTVAFLANVGPSSGGSEVPVALPPEASAVTPAPEWFASPGSDLFAPARQSPPKDAGGDSGRVNPFESGQPADQPSLSSAASSIFTDPMPPGVADPSGGISGGSASVRIGDHDEEQTIFEDPLAMGADASHILGQTPQAAPDSGSTEDDQQEVDWLASDPRTIESAFKELRDASRSGIFAKAHLPSIDPSPSSIFSHAGLDPSAPPGGVDATEELGEADPQLAGAMGARPAPGPAAETPAPVNVEIDWLAGSDESPAAPAVPAAPAPTPRKSLLDSDASFGGSSFNIDVNRPDDESSIHDLSLASPEASRHDEESIHDESSAELLMAAADDSVEPASPRRAREPMPAGRGGLGWLVGALAGMVGGVGLAAAVYFSGLVPNSSPQELPPPAPVVKADPRQEKELAELRTALQALRTESEEKLAKAEADAKKATQELARVQEDMIAMELLLKESKEKVTDLEKQVTMAKTEQAKAELAAKEATEKLALAQKSAMEAQSSATASDQAAKKAQADLMAARKELEAAQLAANQAADKAAKAELAAKTSTDALTAIAKTLQDNKLLPADAADASQITLAVRSVVSKAATSQTPPPPPGLNAEEIKELRDRLARSEAEAKAAVQKLATETAAIKADYTAQMEALKKSHAEELKKLTAGTPDIARLREEAALAVKRAEEQAKKAEEQAALMVKKAQDDAALALKKAQDDALLAVKKAEEAGRAEALRITEAMEAELKKAREESARALKTLSDKLTTEMDRLKRDYEARLSDTSKKHAQEVASLQAELASAKSDLAGVMTPAQALDLWLALLMESRRPADASSAVKAADQVLANAPPGSEAHGKAQATKGLALLILGELGSAKAALEAARTVPDFSSKSWAKVVEEAQASLADPVGKFRKPIDPERRDPRLAVRLLDDGIRLYNARRFADAQRVLIQSVWHDANNPVAWYYLGASRWQLGQREAARDDFRQGAERESRQMTATANIEQALAAIQGPVRAAIADVRP